MSETYTYIFFEIINITSGSVDLRLVEAQGTHLPDFKFEIVRDEHLRINSNNFHHVLMTIEKTLPPYPINSAIFKAEIVDNIYSDPFKSVLTELSRLGGFPINSINYYRHSGDLIDLFREEIANNENIIIGKEASKLKYLEEKLQSVKTLNVEEANRFRAVWELITEAKKNFANT